MKWSALLALLAGLLGAAWLIFHIGFGTIFASVLSIGWTGFALLWIYGAANYVLLGSGWLLLVPPYDWRRTYTFIWGRAVRDSAGDVLPFSQLGGMVIGARATTLRGIPTATAFGSTIVDITLEMIGEIVFVILGLIVLTMHLPVGASHLPLMRITIVGVLTGILMAGGFFLVQRRGFSFLEHISERFVPAATVHAAALSDAVERIHKTPWRMAGNLAIHLAGWLSAAFGTWLVLRLMQKPIGFADAVAIESILCAARSAAIFIPSAIGIQEAGYAMMMPLFGLAPGVGIAVSLVRRTLQIALGIPVLASWQIAEGGHAVGRRNANMQSSE